MDPSLIIVENILQALLTGIVVGGVYGLLCAGLGMIFGVMRVINFAQGEFLMLGMYASLFIFTQFGLNAAIGPVLGPVVSALLAGVLLYAFAAMLHPLLLARVTGTRAAGSDGDGHYQQLTLTLGLSLILQNGALILFGSGARTIQTSLTSSAWEIGPLLGDDISVFLNKGRTVSFLATVVVVLVVALFITRSRTGKMLRAAADNPEAATYMGIDVGKSHRYAFGLGAAITAIGGGLIAVNFPFHPYVGIEFIVIMFAGVVLGGIGSIAGAFWGGLTIGLVQQLSAIVLPVQLQNAAIFVVFLLIILLRPQGLFGRSVDRA
ncbi:branched-chain amino acid ABC transporter permease [Pollutimonas bauzanensis]|uniref:Branched-chain amino acid transport system permease protein n=1 Tax=Pollutimonas bauzanensis TaxID=658167 RepID=A0A1M5R2R0_9BURK|nr:branched-chain amino acid ABC transporter permease [Pollutimonas bauzanensis]SHH20428.1 branched-chain amino acid transport system permease protein [Pollutimonas bauzanensis]